MIKDDRANYEDQNIENEVQWTDKPISDRIHWESLYYNILAYMILFGSLLMYSFGLHEVPMKSWTIAWMFLYGITVSMGITAGAHRLWTHRSYKAKLPFRILLMMFYSAAGLNDLFYWIRDHRVHHKYSETDADPHNINRGFVFAHWGWLVMKRHPECLRRGREVDMSDILADPVVMFQKKHSLFLRVIFTFMIPTIVPVILWNETILHAVLTQCLLRVILTMNIMSTVNSLAHSWGSRPYNRFISPTQNSMVSLITLGEGSHNYHHTIPWDYRASEFPYFNFNLTTLFIHAMTKIGWAYDLRKPSPELVDKVIRRIGDGGKSETKENHKLVTKLL